MKKNRTTVDISKYFKYCFKILKIKIFYYYFIFRATYRAKTCEPTYGRHDAHKHHDTMGEVRNNSFHS